MVNLIVLFLLLVRIINKLLNRRNDRIVRLKLSPRKLQQMTAATDFKWEGKGGKEGRGMAEEGSILKSLAIAIGC